MGSHVGPWSLRHQQAAAFYLTVECPKCQAPIGVPCKPQTIWPHAARAKKAGRAPLPPLAIGGVVIP